MFTHLPQSYYVDRICGERIKTAPCLSVRPSVCRMGNARGSSKAVQRRAMRIIGCGPREFRSDCKKFQHT